MRFFVLLSLLLAAAHPCPAVGASPDGLVLGLGSFFDSPGRFTHRSDATRSLFGRIFVPELGLGYRWGDWQPTVHWTVLGRREADGDRRETILRAEVPRIFVLGEAWELKATVGYLLFRNSGNGEAVDLANGGGTQTFYVPGGSSVTGLFSVGGGAAYTLGRWRLDGDLLLTSLLSRRRDFDLTVGVAYVF